MDPWIKREEREKKGKRGRKGEGEGERKGRTLGLAALLAMNWLEKTILQHPREYYASVCFWESREEQGMRNF